MSRRRLDRPAVVLGGAGLSPKKVRLAMSERGRVPRSPERAVNTVRRALIHSRTRWAAFRRQTARTHGDNAPLRNRRAAQNELLTEFDRPLRSNRIAGSLRPRLA